MRFFHLHRGATGHYYPLQSTLDAPPLVVADFTLSFLSSSVVHVTANGTITDVCVFVFVCVFVTHIYINGWTPQNTLYGVLISGVKSMAFWGRCPVYQCVLISEVLVSYYNIVHDYLQCLT